MKTIIYAFLTFLPYLCIKIPIYNKKYTNY